MRFLIIVSILLVAIAIDGGNCARILGVFNFPSFSHQKLGLKLLGELAKRGHEVTMVTPLMPHTPVNKNITFIDVYVELNIPEPDLFEVGTTPVTIWQILISEIFLLHRVELTLKHASVTGLLNSNQHFDMVIIEQFLNDAFRGFCHRFQAHCVMLSTVGTNAWTNLQMANPEPPSYVPDLLLPSFSPMNFWDRLYNTFVYVAKKLFNHFYVFPKQNELMKEHFPGVPDLSELYYNTSLILVNAHPSVSLSVPLVPNIVPIGGYHLDAPKMLPEGLQKYLDAAVDGAIIFSMGSHFNPNTLPVEIRDVILKTFSKLRQKVLWKWDEDSLPGQPPNVKITKWLPQQDVLAHPNVKLFITHGGLLSIMESIYNGVPILGIPIFADQYLNTANAESDGYGIKLLVTELTEDKLFGALKEVLENPKYSETAKKRSKIFHDEPMKPLDKAAFWVEYVLRHNGANHLKSAALKLTWYQYLLLDVTFFIIFVLVALSFVIFKMIKLVIRTRSARNKQVLVDKSKKST